MSARRRAWLRDGIMVTAVALLYNLFWLWQIDLPTYMDAYYYTTNGARIAEGYGLTEEIIWQYLDAPTKLPTPSHAYWMPLPSFLAALGYLFSDSFRAAQVPFWLLASLLPLLGYAIGTALGAQRWQALLGALLTASGGFYAGWLNQPATFAPFAVFGGTCLLFLGLAIKEKRLPLWFVGGVLAGLAHLTRADGVLLLLVGVSMVLWQRRSLVRSGTLLLLGYMIVMGGWFVRNWMVWQRPLSTAGTQTMFLTTYDDLFAFGRTFDLSHLLSWGWDNILFSRLEAMGLALQTFAVINALIFLLPFVLVGWVYLFWRAQATAPLLLPTTLYAIVLYSVMTLIFTFPGQRGGLFHSSVALWPWCMALAPIGVQRVVEWIARRAAHWRPQRAGRLFSTLFVGLAFILSVGITLVRRPEDAATAVYRQFGSQLPNDAVVMVGNPPHFYYHTNLSAISVPNEPIDITLNAARVFDAEYLILDSNVPRPLAALYSKDESHPALSLIAEQDGFLLYQILDYDDE